MRGLKQYIQRPERPERPSSEDYNKAHWFLTMVQKSTILTVEEKAQLRHDALHGKLDEARGKMEECIARRIGL